MRRIVSLVLGLGLIAAACGDDTGGTVTSAVTDPPVTASSRPGSLPSSSTSTAPAATTPPGATETVPPVTEAPAAGPPLPDGAVAAPDFDLVLGEGGTFRLSDAEHPVYMVFWAEW